ncbi:unnamed protein product [Blepharisma stoltei]|uniref:Uncharacterized protein n=1 Tax=Blepharisma stoltei TaxID=1481888 RepID=A0AAU9IV94_9CILI|nr:unnamed protein product [Blepharisma stoltei]
MANIVNDVNLTSSMVIFHNLGNLLYNIGLSADSARTIDKSIGYVLDYSSQKESFLKVMSEIQFFQNNILSDFKGWEFCPASEITTTPLIPVWSFKEKSPRIEFENIYDTIDNFLFHISSMIKQLNKTRSYKPHTDFLVLNGLGLTYNFFNQTILDLENCVVDQVKSIGIMIYTLLLCGFYALAVLVIAILLSIWQAVKKIDEFWNFFINNSQIAIRKWKCEAVDRLVLVHHNEYYEENWSENVVNLNRKVRTRIEVKFVWRILIFIIISVSYYFILYFYLYPECQNYMINRPKLLNNFNIRRSLVSRVGIFSRDVYSPYFIDKFVLSYGFANSSYLMNLNANILREKNKELREEKFIKMMSKELQQRIFEKSNLTTSLLNFGTEAAVDVSIYDTINISYQDYVPPIEVLRYVSVLQEIQNDIDIEFGLADHDTNEIINSQLKIIIVTTVVYSFILCGLFFMYYLPLLSYQIKELNWIASLVEILVIGTD